MDSKDKGIIGTTLACCIGAFIVISSLIILTAISEHSTNHCIEKVTQAHWRNDSSELFAIQQCNQ